MMNHHSFLLLSAAILPLHGAALFAGEPGLRPGSKESGTGTVHNGALYTQPDPSAPGGLRLRIISESGAVQAVLATPRDDWKTVRFAAPDSRGVCEFKNLPAGRYDLVVVCEKAFYEGLQLSRRADSLKESDREAIRSALNKTNPFFETKRYERMSGATGADGSARVLIQEMRLRPVTLQSAEVRNDIRIRSVKLALLADVGPGWSVTDTREFLRMEVGAKAAVRDPLPCLHLPALSGIRVGDEPRDLGEVRLFPAPVSAR